MIIVESRNQERPISANRAHGTPAAGATNVNEGEATGPHPAGNVNSLQDSSEEGSVSLTM